MAIHLPERTQTSTEALTPRQIVIELDRHVVGQHKAKRAVAIALRNRLRRQKLPKELAEDVAPKNILMIGPTGVGKTEIARRLAKLAQSPFLKVEASKFTEVGYVGRDVESMVRDLVELAITMVRDERYDELRPLRDAGGRGPAARSPAAADSRAPTSIRRPRACPIRPRPRASGCALNCARAGSISARSRSTPATAACRPSRS